MQEGGCQPDLVMFGILLDGFAYGGRMKIVFGLLDDMKVQACTPNDMTLKVLFRNLGPKDTKRVNKRINELFGIVYSPESNEILVKSETEEEKDYGLSGNVLSKGENAALVPNKQPGRGRSKTQTMSKAIRKISEVLKEINRKE